MPTIRQTLSALIKNLTHVDPVVRPDRVKKKVTPLNADAALKQFLDGNPSLLEPIFNRIDLDEQVEACKSSRLSATSGLNLHFSSAEEGAETERQISFVESVFEKIESDQLLEAILEARFRLFRVIEPRWKRDSRFYFTGFTAHPNDYFLFDRDDIYLNAHGKKKPLAAGMSDWWQVVKVRSNKSIYLRCLKPYIRKTFGDESWAHFIEVFSDPFRIGKYPDGAGKDIRDQVWQAVYTIGQDGAAAMPASAAIEFVENRRTGDSTFGGFTESAEQAISKAILGYSAAVDSTPGKLGNENNALSARADLVKADQRFALRWLYAGFVRPLLVFNFPNPANIVPVLTESEVITREEIRAALKLFFDMGGEVDPKQFEAMGVVVQDNAPLLKKSTDFIF